MFHTLLAGSHSRIEPPLYADHVGRVSKDQAVGQVTSGWQWIWRQPDRLPQMHYCDVRTLLPCGWALRWNEKTFNCQHERRTLFAGQKKFMGRAKFPITAFAMLLQVATQSQDYMVFFFYNVSESAQWKYAFYYITVFSILYKLYLIWNHCMCSNSISTLVSFHCPLIKHLQMRRRWEPLPQWNNFR